MRRTTTLLLAGWCVLVATGCGDKARGESGARGAAPGAGRGAGQGGARPPSPVEVAVARSQRVEDAIQGTGQIEAIQSIQLRPVVEGRIVDIYMHEGARVSAGDSLFKVDDAELRAQVARAEADNDLAQQTLQRTRQLMQSQSATQGDLEHAEATARGSQAQLDLLKLRLDRTLVRAPFTGVAGSRTVSLGDYVNSQSQLVTLQTVDPQRVTLTVPERYAERLRVGLRVEFNVAALRARSYVGVVDFVDPVVQLPARTILIKARVPNPRGDLQAGMFAEGRLVAETRSNAVVVPEDAIVPRQGGFSVWVIRGGKAERHDTDVGVRMPGFVELTRGVSAGDSVVVGGAERLAEGAPVRATVIERR